MYYRRLSASKYRPTRVRNTPHGPVVGYDIQPIRDPDAINAMLRYLSPNRRNQFMFLLGINCGLRVSDLLWLRVRDVRYGTHMVTRELKTGKVRRFYINKYFRPILDEYIDGKHDEEFLFASNRWPFLPINRTTAYKILRDAGEACGLHDVGTHSMRKTFGYHFYKRTRDIVTLMMIFNHKQQAVTLDYIGWSQEIVDEATSEFYLGFDI